MTEAILLVGGKGTRLRPLTVTTPKPMLPVAGVPFLTHLLVRARAAGVDHVVLATSYQGEVFRRHYGGGSALDLAIDYVTEERPLGTGGAIRNVAARLAAGPDDPVVVFNGDILSGLDVAGLVGAHLDTDADVTLHLTRVPDPRAFGLVPTDATGRVTRFAEKPERPEDIVTDQVNAGCYVFRRSVIEAIPDNAVVSVERETFPALLAGGARLMGITDLSYWLDLGTPPALVRGSCDLVLGAVWSPALPGPTGEALVLAEARVAPDAKLSQGTTVGARAEVGAGATVEGSVLFDEVIVEEGAEIRGTVLGRGARVGAGTVLDGVVVGDQARVGAHNELRHGARIWCAAEIPDGAIRLGSDQ